MIIATAGHVDHGKTLLVKALTGVDTDRLPEEKARNLTIDLGFAYMPLDGGVLGFVDVPGHERFVRNMLCGVAAIDFVLFIVAADDGPMPQTVEHLAILDLLGVDRGAVALTKIDRVDDERRAEAEEEIEIAFLGTALEGSPVFPVSAITGGGIDDLRAHLISVAGSIAARPTDGNFRLAVDRSFTIVGAGVVVTGTVFSGTVAVGDQLVVSRHGTGVRTEVRVRGIHAQDQKSDRGVAGDRCALNLTGPDLRLDEIGRGDWVTAAVAHNPARRIDARIRAIIDEVKPLKHWTPVHVHLGAADMTGRVAILDGGEIAPGQSALVQLVLDHPIGAWHGDGLILRDQSARRTIGGGSVIDVFPPIRGRARPERLAYLRAMDTPDHDAALEALLAVSPLGLDLEKVRLTRNLTPDEAGALWSAAPMIRLGAGDDAFGFSAENWQLLGADIGRALADWHGARPDSQGATAHNLRTVMKLKPRTDVLGAALPRIAEAGAIGFDGARARLAAHAPKLQDADAKLWQRVEPVLAEAGPRSLTVTELAEETGDEVRRLETFLVRAARLGFVTQVSKTRFFTPAAVRDLAAIAERVAADNPDGLLTPADFRDGSGIGRNLAIEVLEFFDKARFTRRTAAGRTVLKPAAEVFGDQ
jgi:selenocysteine-specific elongation factor